MEDEQGRERVLVLVKALPRTGDKSGATVFSAGVTAGRQWRRQVPPAADAKPGRRFARWQWIAYDWRGADGGPQGDSRRVLEGTIEPGLKMPEAERPVFLAPLIEGSLEEAHDRGRRLALVRPRDPLFAWKRKRAERLDAERHAYALAAAGLSYLGGTARPVEPCPYEFRLKYDAGDGRRDDACADWEMTARFAALSRRLGEKRALEALDATFNLEYPRHGMVCALAADGPRPGRWRLVGVMALAEVSQMALL